MSTSRRCAFQPASRAFEIIKREDFTCSLAVATAALLCYPPLDLPAVLSAVLPAVLLVMLLPVVPLPPPARVLNKEVPREVPDELFSLYRRARLVLRAYYHHHEATFTTMLDHAPIWIVPVGYGQGTFRGGSPGGGRPVSGVTAALEWVVDGGGSSGPAAPGGPDAARDLKWAFAGRLGVHGSRAAMANAFDGWRPHHRAVDRGGAFAGGPLAPWEVAATYRRALFVPSPPGNSPDCFRTYEALVNGAVPLLDGRATDYVWWPSYFGNGSTAAPGAPPGHAVSGAPPPPSRRRSALFSPPRPRMRRLGRPTTQRGSSSTGTPLSAEVGAGRRPGVACWRGPGGWAMRKWPSAATSTLGTTCPLSRRPVGESSRHFFCSSSGIGGMPGPRSLAGCC